MRNSIPLHRAPLDPSVTLATYKAQLARSAAAFSPDPEATAAELQSEIVEITSLQSEGHQKRDLRDVDQRGMTYDQLQRLSQEFSQDRSFIHGFNVERKPDDEVLEVLQDVSDQILHLTGADPENLFLQPVGYGDPEQLECRVGEKSGDRIDQVYSVFFHQTPGMDNGLLLVLPQRPDQTDEADRQNILYQPSLNLANPEKGWQFAVNGTSAATLDI